jgi:hypothetical protein
VVVGVSVPVGPVAGQAGWVDKSGVCGTDGVVDEGSMGSGAPKGAVGGMTGLVGGVTGGVWARGSVGGVAATGAAGDQGEFG